MTGLLAVWCYACGLLGKLASKDAGRLWEDLAACPKCRGYTDAVPIGDDGKGVAEDKTL